MYPILKIAKVAIELAHALETEMKPLKLGKILFYIQALSLVEHDRKLFEEDFYAYNYGPFQQDVFDYYALSVGHSIPLDYKKEIDPNKDVKITYEVVTIIAKVVEQYKDYSGMALCKRLMEDQVWKDAHKAATRKIHTKDMKDFYEKNRDRLLPNS